MGCHISHETNLNSKQEHKSTEEKQDNAQSRVGLNSQQVHESTEEKEDTQDKTDLNSKQILQLTEEKQDNDQEENTCPSDAVSKVGVIGWGGGWGTHM